MDAHYYLNDTAAIYSPALLFYKELIQRNIRRCLEIVGVTDRLRPHCKTHKTREIVQMELDAGINRHKCATLAEAEMLAGCGVEDVLLAYPLVGPNCARLARLAAAYPQCQLSTLIDHPQATRALSEAMTAAGQQVGFFLDVDVGQKRTGIPPGTAAEELYALAATLPGLEPRGLHVYDGHNHQESYSAREIAVLSLMEPVMALREALEKRGLPVRTVVAGGTPTFPIYAKLDIPGLECSPGTCVLHDHGYGSKFQDMKGFVPAALLLTRVISKPTATRLTLDLGYKAVASDPPAGKRCILLNVPQYEVVLQNEEHLVIETPQARDFQPGSEIYAIPTHICPTCAMHQQAYVVEGGRVTGMWQIASRDRMLTV